VAEHPLITAPELELFTRTIAESWIVAGLLIVQPLEALETMASQAEIDGPKYFPEIWRARAQSIMEDREMIAALVKAKAHVLAAAPSLAQLAPLIDDAASGRQRILEETFRSLFLRTEVRELPPAAIMLALVRYIARLAPAMQRAHAPGGPLG
jgi:hypothetical protein